MSDASPAPTPPKPSDDSGRPGIVVTVAHGERRTTLSVPDDLAIELLLPLVVSACGGDGTATWALLPPGGEPIPEEQTLPEAGVWQGAILTLLQTGPGERRPPPSSEGPAGAPQPERSSRSARPSAQRPERASHWSRFGEALRAAGTGAPPSPQGRVDRARAAWRDSGRVARMEAAIAAAPRRRGVVIAIVSQRPGCGKTTVTGLLAKLLARSRPLAPLVVDGDLTSRALSRQLAPTFRMPSATYAAVLERRLQLGHLRPAPMGPAGIRLLPAPDHPAVAPDEGSCAALLSELRSASDVTLLDCEAGFLTPWARAAWAVADQFVLVAEDRPDELAALHPVAARLARSGAAAALVLNRARTASNRAAMPEDPVTAALLRSGELSWDAVPEPWRSAVAGALTTLVADW